MIKEIRSRNQNAIRMHDDLLAKEEQTQIVWPHLKIIWHGEDNYAGDNKRARRRGTQHNSTRNTTVKLASKNRQKSGLSIPLG